MPTAAEKPTYRRTESGRRVRFYDTIWEKISDTFEFNKPLFFGVLVVLLVLLGVPAFFLIGRERTALPPLPVATETPISLETPLPVETETPSPTESPEPTSTPTPAFYDGTKTTIRFPLDSPVLTINGSPYFANTAPVLHNGVHMLSLRTLSEVMGARVEWMESIQTAVFITGNASREVPIGVPLPDDMGVALIIDGGVHIPFRFAAEIVGGDLHSTSGVMYLLIDEMPASMSVPPPATVMRFSVSSAIYTIDGIPNRGHATPFLYNESAMVPLQTIADIMGADFTWHVATQTAALTFNGITLSIPLQVHLPNETGYPVVSAGNLFIPFAYAAELLDAELHWYSRTGAVYLFV
jgi:hypothetical protein